MKKTRLTLALPWYDGPDATTTAFNLNVQHYLAALSERSVWRAKIGHDRFMDILPTLPALDATGGDGGLAEPTEDDWKRLGVLEIMICDYSRTSLVGKARESICETTLAWEKGVDEGYILFWDADMRFEYSAFLRLWRHHKPVVAALAFTARIPVHPVIYAFERKYDPVTQLPKFDTSVPVLNYPKNKLITDADIGGEMAFGAGVMLIDTKVFKEVPQPWFTSTGCGEDWFFCYRLAEHGIPRYVDTGVKTAHLIWTPRWATEQFYEMEREQQKEGYAAAFGELVDRRPPQQAVEVAA